MLNPILSHVIGDEKLTVYYDEDAPNPIEEFDGVDKTSPDYRAWLAGEVYGYVVEKRCPCCGVFSETLDSCWGFYGWEWAKDAIPENAGAKWAEAFK